MDTKVLQGIGISAAVIGVAAIVGVAFLAYKNFYELQLTILNILKAQKDLGLPLDNDLVKKVFSFLDDKSSDKFKEALVFYAGKKHIQSAESVRRSIEEFLKFKLNNLKSFENNLKELCLIFKGKNVDAQIRNIIIKNFY